MTVEVLACPLCRSDHLLQFADLQEDDHRIQYRLCGRCGLVVQSPRMDSEELASFYASGYREAVQGTEEPTAKDLGVQRARAAALVDFCRGVIPRVSRHLDIGSSSGAVLEAFDLEYGCRGIGVEPGHAYRASSAQRGLEVYSALEEVDPSLASAFDLITMSHVLEHLEDPVAYLKDLARRWLAPQGSVLIEVPNLYGHPSLELSHLVAFSRSTLGEALRIAGFGIIKLETHGRPRSRLIPLYLTALARVGHEPRPSRIGRSRARWVPFYRRLGMMWSRLVARVAPGWAWLSVPRGDEG